MSAIEASIGFALRLEGNGFEIIGVLIIIGGVALTLSYVLRGWQRHICEDAYDKNTKIRLGRSLWLGLEILVAADIVKSIAINLTFTSLALLGGLIVVRTFLSWTLVLEIEGRWPWQR
jgi:uncharacterized membrane protein